MGKAKKYPNEKVELEDSDYVQTESDEESSEEMDVSDSGDEDIVSNLFFFYCLK